MPSTAKVFTKTEFDYNTCWNTACASWPSRIPGVTRIIATDACGVEPKSVELHYEGGTEASARYLDRK